MSWTLRLQIVQVCVSFNRKVPHGIITILSLYAYSKRFDL